MIPWWFVILTALVAYFGGRVDEQKRYMPAVMRTQSEWTRLLLLKLFVYGVLVLGLVLYFVAGSR